MSKIFNNFNSLNLQKQSQKQSQQHCFLAKVKMNELQHIKPNDHNNTENSDDKKLNECNIAQQSKIEKNYYEYPELSDSSKWSTDSEEALDMSPFQIYSLMSINEIRKVSSKLTRDIIRLQNRKYLQTPKPNIKRKTSINQVLLILDMDKTMLLKYAVDEKKFNETSKIPQQIVLYQLFRKLRRDGDFTKCLKLRRFLKGLIPECVNCNALELFNDKYKFKICKGCGEERRNRNLNHLVLDKYCSRKCQKLHWNKHKSLCLPRQHSK